MTDRLIFHDLVGPDRPLTSEEDQWLQGLAETTQPADFTLRMGRSLAADSPGPIVRRDLPGWTAGRYIGELYRDGRVLEIRPRLDFNTIAAWAGAALNLHVIPRSAQHVAAPTFIAELLAATWRAALVDAARHGPPGIRTRQLHVSEHTRGQLDVHKTLMLRAGRRPMLASTIRPKKIDNPVSRSIVLADRVLDRRIHRSDWRGDRVDELMPRLRAGTGPRPALPTWRELKAVRYTPITLPYKRVAELSWRIVRHQGLRSTATADRTDGVLIDVAELWELFLLHCAKKAFGVTNVLHGTHLRDGHFLLRNPSADKAFGRMYPDIMVGPVDRPRAIIDAKYKPLAEPRGVDREDLYQLNAYLSAHTQLPLPTGALGFVAFPGQVYESYAEQHSPWTTFQGHLVNFTRLPATEDECIERLRKLFGRQ